MQTRRFGGFCYFWSLVSRPRANGAVLAADSAHPASLRDYRQPINQPGYALAQKGGARLDDMASHMAFSGIRTIQEQRWQPWCRSMLRGCRTWGLMMWLYSNAARAAIPRSYGRAS